MSMKIMKKAMIGAAGVIALVGTASAQTMVSPNPPANPYNFSGIANLTQLGFPANNCTLTLGGQMTVNGDDSVTIEVIEGGSSSSPSGGSALCNTVDLGLDPNDSSTWWTTTIQPGNLPSPRLNSTAYGTFTNVDEVSAVFNCGGSEVDASYTNGSSVGDPSSFTFNDSLGNCTISGTVYVQGDDIDVWE